MFPIAFGEPAGSLYGVYHRPDPEVARSRGAVICQPVFHEFAHSHRALRSLADQLAQAGVHALRFDYRGTGDSAGDGSECDIEQWTDDIGSAMDELKASRGLAEVGLIGLRFGASLAARAAARRPRLPFLVLWEPVLQGDAYLRELRLLQQRWLDFECEQRPGARQQATADELIGFPLPKRLADGMAGVALLSAPALPAPAARQAAATQQAPAAPLAERILLVEEAADKRYDACAQQLSRSGARVTRRQVEPHHIWSHAPDADQVRVPRMVLSGIVDWIGAEATA